MSSLTVLSWNIESLSEQKLTAAAGKSSVSLPALIANLAKQLGVQMITIMEVSRNSSTAIWVQVLAALNAKSVKRLRGATPQEWRAENSDPTGKDVALPSLVLPAKFPRGVDLDVFWRMLQGCYTKVQLYAFGSSGTVEQWVLKATGRTNEQTAQEALFLLNILPRDQEVYHVYYLCDSDSSDLFWWNSNTNLGMSRRLSQLASRNANGGELGYQDPNTSTFNGRAPFLVQLTTDRNASTKIPLLLFHAPFGDESAPRVLANNRLIEIGCLGGTSATPINFAAAPASVICGDFNISYDGTRYAANSPLPFPITDSDSKRTYGFWVANQYQLGISGSSASLKSTLTTVKNADKNDADSKWTDPLQYRVSAYDNIVVKPNNSGVVTNSSIVDVVAQLANAATAQSLVGVKFGGKNPVYNSFKFYREKVSDHLPALATITFP